MGHLHGVAGSTGQAVSRGRHGRPWRRAAAWLALLGPLFYVSYGLANQWAATRETVPSVVYAWEYHLPFLAWSILPYWSINVFYSLSLFFARNRHELDRHGARLLSAQLIAVACFLLWPLHFSFGQPPVEGGVSGFLFAALRSFDQPFNQAPSLHIALAVILWDWYRQRLPRWVLPLWHLWILAICASVLTTWQHHFIDIPTGALLGLLCVWLWPLERRVALPMAWRLTADARRWRLASFYAGGAAMCLVLALYGGGVFAWAAWPAASLTLVALAYVGFGARGFAMDSRGRMHWSARWLYAPYCAGAALNAWLWTRRLPAAVTVKHGLRLGRRPSHAEWRAAGCPRVLSLCAELPLDPRITDARCIAMLDLVIPPPVTLRRAVAMLQSQHQAAGPSGVWVCCALGFSRSAATLLAWQLSHEHHVSLAEAEANLRRVRPQMVLHDDWRRLLNGESS